MAQEIRLGDRVKDAVSGFTGIVIGITDWLNGCRTVGIGPEVTKEGKIIVNEWFDVGRIDFIERPERFAEMGKQEEEDPGGPHTDPQQSESPRRDLGPE